MFLQFFSVLHVHDVVVSNLSTCFKYMKYVFFFCYYYYYYLHPLQEELDFFLDRPPRFNAPVCQRTGRWN